MDRLDFELPEFVRISWVSDPARALWEPRLQAITRAWREIEWRTVAEGVRRCAVTSVSPEQLIETSAACAGAGLTTLPFVMEGVSGASYSNRATKAEAGSPFVYRIVMGKPADVVEFKRAWEDSDQAAIGSMLGHPDCCHAFFHDVWVEEGMGDTTWPMARRTKEPGEGEQTIEVSGPPQNNILWRWMGVRPVSHLPCSFECEKTRELADRYIEIGREHGFEEEMDWMLEVLGWSVEWSALHGLAEIKTPILKVVTSTDATAGKYVVRRRGAGYPLEAGRGLFFPFEMNGPAKMTESRGFKRGIENPIKAANGTSRKPRKNSTAKAPSAKRRSGSRRKAKSGPKVKIAKS